MKSELSIASVEVIVWCFVIVVASLLWSLIWRSFPLSVSDLMTVTSLWRRVNSCVEANSEAISASTVRPTIGTQNSFNDTNNLVEAIYWCSVWMWALKPLHCRSTRFWRWTRIERNIRIRIALKYRIEEHCQSRGRPSRGLRKIIVSFGI